MYDVASGNLTTRGGRRAHGPGFTLVELLVVIGIIALLIAVLMPAMTKARHYANTIKCQSNLHQISLELQIYANNNRGMLFPVGKWDPVRSEYESLGSNKVAYERWPAVAFKMHRPNPDVDNAELYTPMIMRCPADAESLDPVKSVHSYIVNKHLAKSPEDLIKYGSRIPGNRAMSEVILMGEKVTLEPDYYMEIAGIIATQGDDGSANEDDGTPDNNTDFNRLVEQYRHGLKRGSNYLYADWHVGTVMPNEALKALDPWDVGS